MQQQAGVQLDLGCAPPGAHQGEKSPEKEYTRIKDKAAHVGQNLQVRIYIYLLLCFDSYFLVILLCLLVFIELDLIGFNKLYLNFI